MLRWTFAALLAAALLAAPQAAAKPTPGAFEGFAFDPGEEPSAEQWVRFKVSGNRRWLKAFEAKIWVICYVGPPTYNMTLPTTFEMPRAKISRRGVVDHHWTEPYTVDGEEYELEGHVQLRIRKGKATGRVQLSFADCGTTTGDPPGYMKIRAERAR